MSEIKLLTIQKQCNECGKIKEISLFRKKKNGIFNRGAVCKKCINTEAIKHKKEHAIYNKKYRINNRDQFLAYEKQYRKNNKVKLKIKRDNNRDRLQKYDKAYKKHRKETDPYFAFSMRLRIRIIVAIKNQYTKKAYSSIELLGCTIKEARIHIENQFTAGMTWENHGVKGWHIDHVKPCAKFDLTDPVQQKLCFHYSNLQPLWWRDNLSKGAKYEKSN